MNGELGPDDVPFVRVRQLCPGPVSPCCAVAPGLAGSQYSVAAGQWRAAIVDALPMSRCGEFRVFGRQWQFNVRAVGVHGPHETHADARNKGGWHPRSLAPTPRPVPSSNRLLTAPSLSFTASPRQPHHTRIPSFTFPSQLSSKPPKFCQRCFFAIHGGLVLPFGGLQALFFLVALPLLRHLPDQGKGSTPVRAAARRLRPLLRQVFKTQPFPLLSSHLPARKYHRNLIPPTPSPVTPFPDPRNTKRSARKINSLLSIRRDIIPHPPGAEFGLFGIILGIALLDRSFASPASSGNQASTPNVYDRQRIARPHLEQARREIGTG